MAALSYKQMYDTVAATIRELQGFSPEQRDAIARQFAKRFAAYRNFKLDDFLRDCSPREYALHKMGEA